MLKTREELEVLLINLAYELPALMVCYEDCADFWAAFHRRADEIQDFASQYDGTFVHEGIAKMLADNDVPYPPRPYA